MCAKPEGQDTEKKTCRTRGAERDGDWKPQRGREIQIDVNA